MKSVNADLSKFCKVNIYPIADLHIGDAECDMDYVKSLIQQVADDECGFAICNGDICNTALKTSVSDVYGEKLSPIEQIDLASKILSPVKDKILFMSSGNHENRVYKNDGIDITRLIARDLGLEDKYSAEGGILFLKVGDSGSHFHNVPLKYSMYITHGCGGGRKMGGKINRLTELADIVDADIYVMSHVHAPAIVSNSHFRINPITGEAQQVDRMFVNTGAALQYGSYGQSYCYSPIAQSNPIITLSGSRKWVEAKLEVGR